MSATDERETLRDAIATSLAMTGGFESWDPLSRTARRFYRDRADAILAGPLAPVLDELDALRAQVQAARRLHFASPYGFCEECTGAWPCATTRALDGQQ